MRAIFSIYGTYRSWIESQIRLEDADKLTFAHRQAQEYCEIWMRKMRERERGDGMKKKFHECSSSAYLNLVLITPIHLTN